MGQQGGEREMDRIRYDVLARFAGLVVTWSLGVSLAVSLAVGRTATAQTPLDEEPIRYFETPARDTVTKLLSRIERGEAELERDASFGYLPALLSSSFALFLR